MDYFSKLPFLVYENSEAVKCHTLILTPIGFLLHTYVLSLPRGMCKLITLITVGTQALAAEYESAKAQLEGNDTHSQVG